ncbi:MAG: amidohydrolase family protein [Bacteroidota bacterium]
MKKILTFLFTIGCTVMQVLAQSTQPIQPLSNQRINTYAFTHAEIWQDDQTIISDATLIIQKNKIIAVGKGLPIPSDAIVYDLKGKRIIPSFIDAYTSYGQPEVKRNEGQRGPQYTTQTKGAFSWNQAMKPEYNAALNFVIDDKKAGDLRNAGFGTVLTFQNDGIARGTGAVVMLGKKDEGAMLLNDKAAAMYSFNKGVSTQEYPSSLMGTIALLRQTYLDAAWYRTVKEKDNNLSLAAWNGQQNLPQIFEVNNYRSLLRADRLGDEFGVQYIIKGAGDEYRRLAEVKATGASLIVPVNFPEGYDLSNPFDAMNVSLEDLKSWEYAPYNLYWLDSANINYCITTSGCKDLKTFLKNIQKLNASGLSSTKILKALTTTPAKLLKADQQVGAIKKDMQANFLICNGDVFTKEGSIIENWVGGERYLVNEDDSIELRGTYTLKFNDGKSYQLEITGNKSQPEVNIKVDTLKVKVDFTKDVLQYTFRFEPIKDKGYVRLNGQFDNSKHLFSGQYQTSMGNWDTWSAGLNASHVEKKDSAQKVNSNNGPVFSSITYPFNGFGRTNIPIDHPVLIKNITVWTNEKEGILKNTDVLIFKGKITKVGSIDEKMLHLQGLETIDGTNLHLTAGIIDEHSHIAVEGDVNEGTESITAEVRIGDVINPDDINIYRQLSGGVTTSHLLHGSANAIGGQTALIKLRWGKNAEQLKFEGADGFIKFALGENVKQSNWGDLNTIRFPQTRMGVEQVYMDGFTRAREYQKSWSDYNKSGGKLQMPRKDIELEALSEILNKKRFITCHSYQQGEINMLMHVADTFNFKVNTFTHILEGYKVADKMKKHGVGASTFSDWWAYKYEVMEAIPYNGKIMHDMGIVTAFNSDDAEMARRLNQEAAKAVKYGNVSEEEALKFVTLNPAILLHIDNRVGSIKEGKDADVVIWDNNPLSVYAKVQKTFVDGICYYDANEETEMLQTLNKEKNRLMNKSLDEKNKGASMSKPSFKMEEFNHCNNKEQLPH